MECHEEISIFVSGQIYLSSKKEVFFDAIMKRFSFSIILKLKLCRELKLCRDPFYFNILVKLIFPYKEKYHFTKTGEVERHSLVNFPFKKKQIHQNSFSILILFNIETFTIYYSVEPYERRIRFTIEKKNKLSFLNFKVEKPKHKKVYVALCNY